MKEEMEKMERMEKKGRKEKKEVEVEESKQWLNNYRNKRKEELGYHLDWLNWRIVGRLHQQQGLSTNHNNQSQRKLDKN